MTRMPPSDVDGRLLDTTIASALWDTGHRAHSEARGRVAAIPKDLIFVSVVTLAEVDYGMEIAPNVDVQRQLSVREKMRDYEIFDISKHTAVIYAHLRAELFRKYSPKNKRGRLTAKRVESLLDRTTAKEIGVQENDLWIVSVAIEHDLILATDDQAGGMTRILDVANYLGRTEYWLARDI